MIFDDMADVIGQALGSETAGNIGRIIGRNRKTVSLLSQGCTFHCDYDLVIGLKSLGYEMRLVKLEA